MSESSKSGKVLTLTISNGLNVLINFLTLPYLLRTLSLEDYGTYGQVIMIIGILQGIFTYGLNQVSTIYLAKPDYSPHDVFHTLTKATAVMAFLSVLVMAVLTPSISAAFKNEKLTGFMFLSLINLFGQVPLPVFMSVLVFFNKVKSVAFITVVMNVLKVAVMLLSIQFFKSVSYLMSGLSLVSVLHLALLYLYVPSGIRRGGSFRKGLVRTFFNMSTPLVLAALVERSLIYVDGLMISVFLGTAEYAYYRAGAVEVPFVAGLYGAVATIVMPEVSRLFVSGKLREIIRLKRTAISATAFFVYPVLIYLVFFSGPLMSLYLSSNYATSVLVFAIFNLSLLIRINDYQDVLIVSGNSRYIFFSVIFSSVLNIGLNYMLIRYFGIAGSAMAFIISLFVFACLLARKSFGVLNCSANDIFDFKHKLIVIVLSSAIAALIYCLNDRFFRDVWFIVAAAPLYAVTLFYIGIRMKLLPATLLSDLKNKVTKSIYK